MERAATRLAFMERLAAARASEDARRRRAAPVVGDAAEGDPVGARAHGGCADPETHRVRRRSSRRCFAQARVRRRRAAGVARDGLGDQQGVPQAVARRASGQIGPARRRNRRSTSSTTRFVRCATRHARARRSDGSRDRAFKEKCARTQPSPSAPRRRRNARTRWTSRQTSCGSSASTARASRRSARRRWRDSGDASGRRTRRATRATGATRRTPRARAPTKLTGSKPTATTGLKRGRGRGGAVAPIPTRTPTTPGWRGQCSGTAAGAGAVEAKARGLSTSSQETHLAFHEFHRPRRDCTSRRVS